MRVLILAAGLGTRLRPLTDTVPKCLVNVDGKPMLQHWLEKIEKLDEKPTEVFVNVFYKKDLVKDFLRGFRASFPIISIDEKELLGTGGTLLNLLRKHHDENMLVIHCDNYFDDELNDFLREASSKLNFFNADAVVLSFRTMEPNLCGTMQLDTCGKILKFQEKVENPNSNLANGAVYYFSSSFLNYICNNHFPIRDIAKDLLEPNEFNFYAFETSKFFCDIGTYLSLKQTRNFVNRKRKVCSPALMDKRFKGN